MFDYKSNMEKAMEMLSLLDGMDRGELISFEEYFEQRKAAIMARQERQFQDDWTMAIGLNVLWDRGIREED